MIDRVVAGANEVTATKADAFNLYMLFFWAKGSNTAVPLANPVTADKNGKLDFKGITQTLSAGDTLRILDATRAPALLQDLSTDESREPAITVAAVPPPNPAIINPVVAGANEVTATKANAFNLYMLFYWVKGSNTAISLGNAVADKDGNLDFKGITQILNAGDTLRVLDASDAPALLADATADESNQPAVIVAAAAAPSPIMIAPVAAGANEVTATKADAFRLYALFYWAKGSGTPVNLGSVAADSSGDLDFKGISQSLNAGDVLRILNAAYAHALLSNSSTDVSKQPNVTVGQAPAPAAEPARVIVGYEQSGANSANAAGRLYAEVYYEHPVWCSKNACDNKQAEPKKPADPGVKKKESANFQALRIFGDVRIGSGAQNSTSTVGNFVTGLSGAASSLKLNQIASVAEFLTGFEYSFRETPDPNRFRLSIFGEYGATGNLQAAELNNIYAFPSNTSQAYSLLVAAEQANPGYNPSVSSIPTTCVVGSTPKIPGVANNCMYIEFSQAQPYFDQEAYIGPKFVFFGPLANTAPNVISMGFGANHAVNRDMSFNAVRVDGLVPISIPSSGSKSSKTSAPAFYLFGNASLALNHSNFPNVNNYIPFDAASTVTVAGVPQTQAAGNTYVIRTLPKPEEYYSIGAGLDLVGVWSELVKAFGPKSQ